MKAGPIIMSGPMVCALLAGRKTQTRRFRGLGSINERPDHWTGFRRSEYDGAVWQFFEPSGEWRNVRCPFGMPGDLLYVRETFADLRGGGFMSPFAYRADGLTATGREDADHLRCRNDYGIVRWKPSIHMPRKASRLTLKLTDVRVERLQEIGADDCEAEGIYSRVIAAAAPLHSTIQWVAPGVPMTNVYGTHDNEAAAHPSARRAFEAVWTHIHGPDAWDENPWLWALSFEVIQQNVDDYLKAA